MKPVRGAESMGKAWVNDRIFEMDCRDYEDYSCYSERKEQYGLSVFAGVEECTCSLDRRRVAIKVIETCYNIVRCVQGTLDACVRSAHGIAELLKQYSVCKNIGEKLRQLQQIERLARELGDEDARRRVQRIRSRLLEEARKAGCMCACNGLRVKPSEEQFAREAGNFIASLVEDSLREELREILGRGRTFTP